MQSSEAIRNPKLALPSRVRLSHSNAFVPGVTELMSHNIDILFAYGRIYRICCEQAALFTLNV